MSDYHENSTENSIENSIENSTEKTAVEPIVDESTAGEIETDNAGEIVDNNNRIRVTFIDPLEHLENGEALPKNNLLDHRIREITHEVLKTAEGRVAHTLAYINQVQNLFDRLALIEGGMLALAKELNIYLPMTTVNSDRVIAQEMGQVTDKGRYDINQLRHIIALMLTKIRHARNLRQENTAQFGVLQKELDETAAKLVEREQQLRLLQSLPLPPMINVGYRVYYRDNKDRDNFITIELENFIVTRRCYEAMQIIDLEEAAKVLAAVLQNPEIKNRHLFEIVSLHTVNYPLSSLSPAIAEKLIELRKEALASETPSKKRRKKHRRRNRE